MSKLNLYLPTACALSALLLCLNITSAISKQSSTPKKRSVFVAVTKIRKGEKIQKRMIVEELLPESDFPNGAIEFRWLILGKRPSHDLPPTKLIQESDFINLPGINVPFICTTKAIPAGAHFKESDLKVFQTVYYSRVPPFPQRPTNISAVVGKKARINFKEGHELINGDIVP